jgi:hypothetical protein
MKKILAICFLFSTSDSLPSAAFQCSLLHEGICSVSQKVDDVCSKCGVKTKKDCCKTEIKVVKVDDSQKSDFLKIDFLNRSSVHKSIFSS